VLGSSGHLRAVASFRELLGSGPLCGMGVIPASDLYVNNGIMVLAPGAFIRLGILIWCQRALSGYKEVA